MERYYANVVNAQSGPYDLTLDFGQKVGEAEPEYEVRVGMSWEHAVSLLLVLRTMIDNYEAQVGVLPDVGKVLSPRLQPPAEATGQPEGDE